MVQSTNNSHKKAIYAVLLVFFCCTMSAQKYNEAVIVHDIAKSQNQPNMYCLLSKGRGVYPSTRVFMKYNRRYNDAFLKIREKFGLPQQNLEDGDTLFLIDYHAINEFKHYSASWIHSRPETFKISGYYGNLYMKDNDKNPQFRFNPYMTRLCNEWDLAGIFYESHWLQPNNRLEYMMLTRIIYEVDGKYSIESVPFISWDIPFHGDPVFYRTPYDRNDIEYVIW